MGPSLPKGLDCTVQVMSDLRDVGLPESMEFLTSKSEKVFKKNVKAKIKIFEFSNLLQERKSKTINLKYSHLKMQDYLLLKNMNKKERIQKIAFHTILGDKYNSYTSALKTLGMEKLSQRRKQLCLKFAKRSLKSSQNGSNQVLLT